MKEIWKDIKSYEGDYMVSSTGRVSVVSTERDILKIVKQSLKNNYLSVMLRKNGKNKNFRVGRLVGLAFIPNPENKQQVNHINGIKTDNRADNIEWSTPSENTLHAYKTGLAVSVKGINKPCSKLTENDVREIKSMFNSGHYKQIRLAEKYKVSHPTIHKIVTGEKWKHIV